MKVGLEKIDLYTLGFGDQICNITEASLLAPGRNHAETVEERKQSVFQTLEMKCLPEASSATG